MAFITLNPSSTVSNTGDLVGAASAHVAVNDASDSSYLEFGTNELAVFALDDLTLPAGGIISGVRLYTRVRANAGTISLSETLYAIPTSGPSTSSVVRFNSTTPTTVLMVTAGPDKWTDPNLDSANLKIQKIGSGGGLFRIYKLYVEVHYGIAGTLTVDNPTGTLTATNLASTTWTASLDPDGGPQTRYRVKIFTAAQYGAGGFDPETSTATIDSGYLAGTASSWSSTTALANATYRSYVKVSQTVGVNTIDTTWGFSGFIVNVPVPNNPTIVLTPSNTLGRIQITVTAGGGVTTDAYEVDRSDDGGVTWVAVRNGTALGGLILTAGGTTYDYEAPNGTLVTYRTRTSHNYLGTFASTPYVQATATWTSNDWWIKHPNLPALNVLLNYAMLSYSQVNHAARQTAFQPLGAILPIVVSDTRSGATGSISLVLNNVALQNAVDRILDASDTLLLQGPVANAQPDRYVRFGDHSSERVVDKSWAVTTTEVLPWTQVAIPLGAQT